mmetsp:Transcript_126052/g.362582  ORF Transcript_126052/g.362582 Transcript_126052/m.362582 type:complete len:379 (+) Transcript_126052:46-1182(+)
MAQEEDSTNNYRIKDIVFFGSPRRILLQSANGPCPLLAICNVLLLRNQLSISNDTRYISFNELIDMVSSWLFDANAAASAGDGSADVRESLDSCLEVLPRLNVGLDVNCKFSGPSDFEYTRELAIFDLCDINLFHGWLVSKQDERAHKVFGHLSYNQVVEKLIAMQEVQTADGAEGDPAKATEREQVVEEGLLIQEFLDRTASQLSYDGLLALHETVRERQLGVFFRNSHFNTIMKYEGDLYLLCTDIAFAHTHVVWEKLDEVDGDTSYCDANFNVNGAGSDEAAALAAAQAAQDHLLAAGAGGSGMDADALLAMRLMQEDLEAPQQAPRQQPQQPPLQQQQPQQQQQQQQREQERQPLAQSPQGGNTASKKKCCVVL